METVSHVLTLTDRQSLSLTGVSEVTGFDPGEIELVTSRGRLVVTGTELSVGSLDLASGLVSVTGTVSSIEYLAPSPERRSVLSKLFGAK